MFFNEFASPNYFVNFLERRFFFFVMCCCYIYVCSLFNSSLLSLLISMYTFFFICLTRSPSILLDFRKKQHFYIVNLLYFNVCFICLYFLLLSLSFFLYLIQDWFAVPFLAYLAGSLDHWLFSFFFSSICINI